MVDVLLRWLFSAPIEGYEDIIRLLSAIIVASCFPTGLLRGRNITIRFLGKAFGRRATQYLEALGVLATLFCFTVVT
jgi:TRAP-type C4-dicarboxylate transport system permease small subunit